MYAQAGIEIDSCSKEMHACMKRQEVPRQTHSELKLRRGSGHKSTRGNTWPLQAREKECKKVEVAHRAVATARTGECYWE
jgi:hypothetical protein